MRFDAQARSGAELLRIGGGEFLAADGAEEAILSCTTLVTHR